jgi:alkylation response protein AidB-like acyl-CoA dehydrogenase
MRDTEIFQAELGRIVADVRAARAFLRGQLASHWRRAEAGTLKDEALYVEAKQAAIWLAATSMRVADACFTLGGGSALYETSPLQRRLRDLHTAGQHASAQPRGYVAAGKLRLDRSAEPANNPAPANSPAKSVAA